MQHRVDRFVAAAGLTLLALALGLADDTAWRTVLPLQDLLLRALLPQLEPVRVELIASGSGLALWFQATTPGYLALPGVAWPPGEIFEAQTPIRASARAFALACGTTAWWSIGHGAARGLRLGMPLLALGSALLVALAPLVLAGETCALLLRGPEPTPTWLLAACSGLLLRGGDVALMGAFAFARSPPPGS